MNAVLALSAAQQAFWLGELLHEDRGARATLSFGLDLPGAVDQRRLQSALVAVAGRHPLLRARFDAGRDGLSLTVEDAVETEISQPAGSLDAWAAQPVSIRDRPLWRAGAERRDGRTRLRVVVQHAVFDGYSKDVFLRDLLVAYDGGRLEAGDPSFWSAFVEREHAARAAESRPKSASLPAAAGRRFESLRFAVEPSLRLALDDAAAAAGVSVFVLQLAAWHAAIARLDPGADVVTPVAFSTRSPAETDAIGPFVNQLPVGSRDAGSRSLRELAAALGEQVRELANDRHRAAPASESPADEVAVSYRRDALRDFPWPGPSAVAVRLLPLAATASGVAIRMIDHGRSITGAIDVDLTVRPGGYAQRLVDCWRTLLRG